MTRNDTVPRGAGPDKVSDRAPDLLVVSAGNTHTRVVRYAGERVVDDRRTRTEVVASGQAPDGLVAGLPWVLVSVVPAVTRVLQSLAVDGRVFVVSAAGATGLQIAYEPPTALGADRLANAFLLWQRRGHGIVVDFGTATTLTVVAPPGRLVGGAILPGLATAMASLHAGTALLPEVPIVAPDGPWGTTTVSSIQHGVVAGQVGAVCHLLDRMAEGLPAEHPVVVTGGWAKLMAPLLGRDVTLAPDWTVEAARCMYLCNTRHRG